MAYRLSQKACEQQSNEKVVQFPNKEMINQNAAKEHPHLFTLTAILTAPNCECCMNFQLNTGDKTNQVTNSGLLTTKENKIPQDKQLKKVVISYCKNSNIEWFEFFDKDGNSFFEAGMKVGYGKLEVVLEDDECLMGIQAQEYDTDEASSYTNMQLMIRKK